MMKGWIEKIFHIYPGEEKRAFLFASLGFLWAFAVTSGLKYADALFLLHVGAPSLPNAYTYISCGMIGLASFLIYAYHHFTAPKIFSFVLCLGIVFYGSVFLFLDRPEISGSIWTWYALKVFGYWFFSMVLTAYWSFIDQYHHLQDAKRLYSLFSSMIFLGVASTGLVMNSGKVDYQVMCLGIVVLLVAAQIWIRVIVKQLPLIHEESESAGRKDLSISKVVKGILNSPFTLTLMAGNFLVFVLLVITEYNYLSFFDQRFDPGQLVFPGDEEHSPLTQFLGKWIAIVSICNLFFGLLFYSRLLRRYGIGALLLITPAILVLTFGGWLVTPQIIFPIMGLFVVEGTYYVVNDCNFNLLLNAVPNRLKYKIRIAIELFFEPTGMLISSLLLSVPWINSKLLGFCLAIASIIVAIKLGRSYLKAIYQNLSDNSLHFERSPEAWINKMSSREKIYTKKYLIQSLADCNETTLKEHLEAMTLFQDQEILKTILSNASVKSNNICVMTAECLLQSPYKDSPIFHDFLLKQYQTCQVESVRHQLAKILSLLSKLPPHNALESLFSTQIEKQTSALITFSAHSKKNNKLVSHFSPYVESEIERLLNSDNKIEVIAALTALKAASSPSKMPLLIPHLFSDSLEVAMAAATAIEIVSGPDTKEFNGAILTAMKEKTNDDFRTCCLRALSKTGDPDIAAEILKPPPFLTPSERRAAEQVLTELGSKCSETLFSFLKDPHQLDRSRIIAARALARIDLQDLRKNLEELIKQEATRAEFYYFHACLIQEQNPAIDLKLLKDSLMSSYRSVLDFIIQLLGVSGELEDFALLSRCQRSPNPKIRSQVAEAIEKTCEKKLFKWLQPLLSEQPAKTLLREYSRNGGKLLSLNELLLELSYSPLRADQVIAVALMHQLRLDGWKQAVERLSASNVEIFEHFAEEILKTS